MKEELNVEKTNSGRLEADKLTFERQVRELQGISVKTSGQDLVSDMISDLVSYLNPL